MGAQLQPHRVSEGLVVASVVYALLLTLCYLIRPDGAAAVTVLPAWAWAVPGVGVMALGWRAGRPWLPVALLCWLAYLLCIPEETASLLRACLSSPTPAPHHVRVVSLNCAGGNPLAAAEVAAYRPHLVLLQETPSRPHVQALARTLFGGTGQALVGPDTAILCDGTLTPLRVPASLSLQDRGAFVCATVKLPNGVTCDVLSLRLLPPLVRMDYYSPECWRDQRENRQDRRRQLRRIFAAYQQQHTGRPLILGGDFNAPGGDAACRVLRPTLRDAFASAGMGWGNTHSSEFPIVRIDQLWSSPTIQPLTVRAYPSRHSDHCLVVADFYVQASTR